MEDNIEKGLMERSVANSDCTELVQATFQCQNS